MRVSVTWGRALDLPLHGVGGLVGRLVGWLAGGTKPKNRTLERVLRKN